MLVHEVFVEVVEVLGLLVALALLGNLLIDIAYGIADPRVRVSG